MAPKAVRFRFTITVHDDSEVKYKDDSTLLFPLQLTTLFPNTTHFPIMEAIKDTFAQCKKEQRSALVTYVTAGYPTAEDTVEIMLGMEAGGAGLPTPSL